MHPDQSLAEQDVALLLDRRAETLEFDHRIVRPDGKPMWLRERGQLVRDQDGAPARVVGTALDVTAHKLAAEQLRKQCDRLAVLGAAVERPADAVITVSSDGVIMSWNGGARQVYGHTAEEAVGQHLSLMLSKETSTRLPGILASAEQRRARLETVNVRKDGSLVEVEVGFLRSMTRGAGWSA